MDLNRRWITFRLRNLVLFLLRFEFSGGLFNAIIFR